MKLEELENDLVLFVGAGASKTAGIPTMYEFVDEFKKSIQQKKEKQEILDKVIGDEKIDLEELLMRLFNFGTLLDNKPFLKILKPTATTKQIISQINNMKEELMDFVYERCSDFNKEPAKKLFNKLYEMKKLFELDRIKLFTTNYDICAETCIEESDISLTTGFKMKGRYPIWDRSVFDDPTFKVHIYKIHGSITWYKYVKQIFQLPPFGRYIDAMKGQKFEAQMMYPLSGKEVFTSPYSELQYYLQKNLLACPIVVVIGYSFRDDSIISIFENALRENKQLKIVIICPEAQNIAKKFSSKENLFLIEKKIEDVNLKEDEFDKLNSIMAETYQNMTFNLRDSKDYKNAIDIGKKAIKISSKNNYFDTAGRAAICISDCYKHLDKTKDMTDYAQKTIDFYKESSEENATKYHNLAVAFDRLNKKDEIKANLEIAIDKYKQEGKTNEEKRDLAWLERLK